MQHQAKNIILAEDDEDDSLFFEEALRSVPSGPSLIRARDMPRKNGAQCLMEIRKQEGFKHLPIVVLSTSASADIIESIYKSGANLYVQKPNDIGMWKRVIAEVIGMDWNIHTPFPVKENFTLLSA